MDCLGPNILLVLKMKIQVLQPFCIAEGFFCTHEVYPKLAQQICPLRKRMKELHSPFYFSPHQPCHQKHHPQEF